MLLPGTDVNLRNGGDGRTPRTGVNQRREARNRVDSKADVDVVVRILGMARYLPIRRAGGSFLAIPWLITIMIC